MEKVHEKVTAVVISLILTSTFLAGCTTNTGAVRKSVSSKQTSEAPTYKPQVKASPTGQVLHQLVSFVHLGEKNIEVLSNGKPAELKITDETTYVDEKFNKITMEQFKASVKSGDKVIITQELGSDIATSIKIGDGMKISF
ncbi:MAG: hypothetical protein KKF30_14615 [Proteobacteria bacterium]|nr:hypothetical protein [Pseudomonadota bacterium]MBU4469764.1 hypothetical protein [Pseudomonadota bacterium]MCG2753856.1 hypothetical protein [Desulfobacteraceae bacterium]